MDKTIIATFTPGSTFARCSLWQWDTGVQLCIQGLELTEAPLVHWGRVNECTAMVVESTLDDGQVICQIPDELIGEKMPGNYCVDAWIYVTDGNVGRTIRSVQITVKARKRPDSYTSTPSRAKTWDSIESDAATAKETAADALEAAEAAQTAAAAAQTATETASTAAQTAQDAATAAKTAAEGKADGLTYENTTLSLLAGENVLSEVKIDMPAVDAELSSTSENAVQNKVIKAALDEKATKTELTEGLATKQDAGDYALKSEIPTADITANTAARHTHDNMSILNDLTETQVMVMQTASDTVVTNQSKWDTAYDKSHTHNNKTVLDGITSDKVKSWDGKAEKSDIPEVPVRSVNNKTGAVKLTADDVNAIKAVGYSASDMGNCLMVIQNGITTTPVVTKINNQSGTVTLSAADVGALPDTTTSLKNPNALTITIGSESVVYDGSEAKSITIEDGTEVTY